MSANLLYYGDNLDILEREVSDETVDLVYLDPPFNSNQNYNILFKERDGSRAAAQELVFWDTWHWNAATALTYEALIESGPEKVAHVLRAFRTFLGDNDMLAYLSMMAPRLIELRRVLKPNGSLYLHCDPTASHYLKLLLDAVYGPGNFRNEIVWKRTSAHSSAKRYGPVHDTLLFYSKTDSYMWNPEYQSYDQSYLNEFYTHVDKDGRRWRRSDLTGAGTRNGATGEPWRGLDVTAKGRHWAYPPATLEKMDAAGKIHWPAKQGGMPMLKRYADEQKGVPLQDIWTDLKPLHNLAAEREGYPTQKPEALLERIIRASCPEGGTVLDPFCGCGTTVAAAQNLGRNWIGIDITYRAITIIRDRLSRTHGPAAEYSVHGLPSALSEAKALATQDRHQFQWWALDFVGVRQQQRKGADRGIDGRLFFHDEPGKGKTKQIIFSVKSGHVGVKDIRELSDVVRREGAQIGVFLTLEPPTRNMRSEAISAGFYKSPWGYQYQRIQILTIEDLFDGRTFSYPDKTGGAPTKKQARGAQSRLAEALELPLVTDRDAILAQRKEAAAARKAMAQSVPSSNRRASGPRPGVPSSHRPKR
jgi:DNA modification methylase